MAPGIANQPKVTSAFRLLLWLKWTLMWRGIGRDKMRLAGTIVMLVFCTPVSIGLAVVCWLLVVHAPPMAPVVTRAAFGFAYLLWLVTPLLGFPLNESYDPTRLFVFPVSYRTIFLAAVTGGCFDLSTLLILPVFLALLIALSPNPLAALASLVLIALFLLQTIATAQAVMLALIGFLRSRRFRDITMVLLPLVGMTWYVLQQTAVRHFSLFATEFRSLVSSPVWNVLGWLPPGWAASGMIAAHKGHFALSILYMVLLAAVCAAMASVSAYVMRQLYLGDRGPLVKASPASGPSPLINSSPQPQPFSQGEKGGGLPVSTPLPLGEGTGVRAFSSPGAQHDARTARYEIRKTGDGASGWGLLPPALSAVVQKELTYLWREPQYRVLAINMIYTLVIFALAFVFNPGLRLLAGPYGPLAGHIPDPLSVLMRGLVSFRIVGILLLASLPLVFNIFGGEGAAITLLFSFPTPRRYLFIGKNLAHGVVIIALCVLGVVGGSYFTRTMDLAALGLLEAVVAVPIMMAAGNLISVRFPYRMVVRGQRWGRGGQVSFGGSGVGAGAGCGYAFIYALCYLATFVALVPTEAAAAVPILMGTGPLWVLLGLVAAAAYSLGLYAIGLYLASSWLLTRETAIIERLVPNE